jgi:hypothetical protein
VLARIVGELGEEIGSSRTMPFTVTEAVVPFTKPPGEV